jgi:hypothetical protein
LPQDTENDLSLPHDMEKVDLLVDIKKKAWAKWINRSSSLSSNPEMNILFEVVSTNKFNKPIVKRGHFQYHVANFPITLSLPPNS